MAITNTDQMPGTYVSIQDGQLRGQRPLPGTKLTLLVTTTSQVAALNDPVVIDNIPRAMNAYKHLDGKPSEATKALAEAVRVGAQNIEMVVYSRTTGELMAANDRFDALETAYDTLRQHDVDFVVPVGAHADLTLTGSSPGGWDRTKGYHRQLGNFCYQATKEWNSCFGVIGVRPLNQVAYDESWTSAPSSTTGILFDDPPIAHLAEWAAHLRSEVGTDTDHTTETMLDGHVGGSTELAPGQVSSAYDGWAYEEDGSAAVDRNQVAVDGGSFVAISAIIARVTTDETQNLANDLNVPAQTSHHVMDAGAVGLASLLTQLEPHEGATNKRIPGYIVSRKVGQSTALKMLRARYVSMCDRGGNFVVLKGVTAGYNASAYTRTDFTLITTRQILHSAVDIVRNRGFKYIGGPIDGARMAAMEAEMSNALEAMKPSGAVRSFSMYVNSTPEEQALGEVNVDLALVIGHELTKINAFVELQKPEALSV